MATRKEQLAVFENEKPLDPRDTSLGDFFSKENPEAFLGGIKDEKVRQQAGAFFQEGIDPRDEKAMEFAQEFSLEGLPEKIAKQKAQFTGNTPDLRRDRTAADFLQGAE